MVTAIRSAWASPCRTGSPTAMAARRGSSLAGARAGMTGAIHDSFYVMLAAAVVGLVVVFWFPKALPTTSQAPEPIEEPEAPAEREPVGAAR